MTMLAASCLVVVAALVGANAATAEATTTISSSTPAAPAAISIHQREAAGQYVFSCVLENGRVITLGTSQPKKGACKGWIQVHIGGKQIASINTGGKLGPGDTVSCLAGTGVFLVTAFSGPVGWSTAAGLILLGLGCSGH
ncbi:hypothetical protein [Frondihabitans sp. 762G35]|uniref:hypothetical protein n=1 Tax=Frondihabitans sp. 762G35 TaxID=1446794 RepID=UPI000F4D4AA0|nr:hypothetical protein [Frondihabitans sp. 762G35]